MRSQPQISHSRTLPQCVRPESEAAPHIHGYDGVCLAKSSGDALSAHVEARNFSHPNFLGGKLSRSSAPAHGERTSVPPPRSEAHFSRIACAGRTSVKRSAEGNSNYEVIKRENDLLKQTVEVPARQPGRALGKPPSPPLPPLTRLLSRPAGDRRTPAPECARWRGR